LAKKKTERQKAVERADKYASIYIRLRDADQYGYVYCCTCGDRGYWEKDRMHNGHFMAKGNGATLVRWLPHNMHPQCDPCNTSPNAAGNGRLHFHSKKGETSLIEYTRFMQEKYGNEIIDDLKARKFQTANYTLDEIQEIGTLFKELGNLERKEKGL
jgi:hypothetical protein